MGTGEDSSMTSPPLTEYEFNMALALCDLSYEKNKADMTYPGFKKHVLDKYDTMMKEFGIDTKTYSQVPYIAYFDKKIRVIVTNHGGVGFASREPTHSTNTPRTWHFMHIQSSREVVLCGHSRGGSVAHVVHYNLITNPNFCFDKKKEITSVAFGSTPFLRSQQPAANHEHRFLTYVAERDVVPALFSAPVKSLLAAQAREKYTTKIGLVRYLVDFDIAFALERAVEVLQGPLGEYLYYGKWTKLSEREVIHHDNEGVPFSITEYSQSNINEPLTWFKSADFLVALALDNMMKTHSLKNAYKSHMHQAVEVPKPSVDLTLRINRHMTVAAARYLVPPDIYCVSCGRVW
ncbi:hypothetical protein AC1031_008456 [Aphanomyces cochlioides]|nr:hypothetical protein AC1031_008456 [Aphanomyces cochlioides]